MRDVITFDDARNEFESDDYSDIDFDNTDSVDIKSEPNDVVDKSKSMIEHPDEYPYFPSHDEAYSNISVCNELILCDSWLSEYIMTIFPAVMLPKDPVSLDEAMNGPHGEEWRAAIQKEFDNFDVRNTFGEAAQTGRAMKTKLILKYMFNNDYTLKFKARLVACGYSQVYGVDYKETYAPTTSCVAVFLIFQLGMMHDCNFAMFDVSAAFLEGKNDY